jgi:hypothetical protein
MNTGSGTLTDLRDHLRGFVCDIRGHDWAGARQFEAHSDGLLLCLRCGYATDKTPKARRLIALH